MGIFSGLKKLGLGGLEDMNLFEDPHKETAERTAPVVVPPPRPTEKNLIYDRSFVCPVCDSHFTAKIMKSNKAKLIGTDPDLRARYEGIDAVKYDVVMCPVCAYAALIRFFPHVTTTQAKMIKEKISQVVKLTPYSDEIYSYEEAIQRYKLALVSALVKHSRPSEKAYLCLRNAWLLRGYAESIQEKNPEDVKIGELKEQEEELLSNAYKGFTEARQSESFPICGMNTVTFDYLLAVLAAHFKEYETAGRLVSGVLMSPGANARIKDRAREMKTQIAQERKNQAAQETKK